MTLSTRSIGDVGHVSDHNAIAAILNAGVPALEGTTAPPDTNTTGGVKGTASTAAHSDHTHRIGDHDHSAAGSGSKLAQANTHQSPDTDSATTSLHHTIGVGANQAAAGNHTHTKTIRVAHTFAVSGTLNVASGAANYIPPFYVAAPAGQTATIAKVRAKARAGTVTVAVTKNGTNVTGLSAVSVTTTATTTTASGGNTCADGDEIAIVLSSPSAADGLTVTVWIDYVV